MVFQDCPLVVWHRQTLITETLKYFLFQHIFTQSLLRVPAIVINTIDFNNELFFQSPAKPLLNNDIFLHSLLITVVNSKETLYLSQRQENLLLELAINSLTHRWQQSISHRDRKVILTQHWQYYIQLGCVFNSQQMHALREEKSYLFVAVCITLEKCLVLQIPNQ